MSRINHLAFWVGGVLFPTISKACLETLAPGNKLDSRTQLELDKLETLLRTGKMDVGAYCHEAIAVASFKTTANDLNSAIPNRLEVLSGMLDLVAELAENYRLSAVSDYPGEWVLPAMQRTGLSRRFPPDSVFILPEHDVLSDYADLFGMLMSEDALTPGQSLWVDHNSRRASAAIRSGVDAAIFVDAARLYRDLGLWSLVPFEW